MYVMFFFFVFFPFLSCRVYPPSPWLPCDTFLSSCLLNLHFIRKFSSVWFFDHMFMKILSASFVPPTHQDEQAFIFWADAPTGGKSSFLKMIIVWSLIFISLSACRSLSLVVDYLREDRREAIAGTLKYLSSRLPAVHPALLSSKTLTHICR